MYRPQSFFHLQTSDISKDNKIHACITGAKIIGKEEEAGASSFPSQFCEHILYLQIRTRVILEEMRDLSVRSLRSDWAWVKTKQKSTEKSIQASLHRYQQ